MSYKRRFTLSAIAGVVVASILAVLIGRPVFSMLFAFWPISGSIAYLTILFGPPLEFYNPRGYVLTLAGLYGMCGFLYTAAVIAFSPLII